MIIKDIEYEEFSCQGCKKPFVFLPVGDTSGSLNVSAACANRTK